MHLQMQLNISCKWHLTFCIEVLTNKTKLEHTTFHYHNLFAKRVRQDKPTHKQQEQSAK